MEFSRGIYIRDGIHSLLSEFVESMVDVTSNEQKDATVFQWQDGANATLHVEVAVIYRDPQSFSSVLKKKHTFSRPEFAELAIHLVY